MTKTKVVTKKTNMADLIFKYPDAEEVLLDYGLHCSNCFAAGFDTIEQGASLHGMESDDIQEMIDRINELVETGE